MSDARLHIVIDEQLSEIMIQHCKCNEITRSRFIADCIAEALGITLKPDGSLDTEDYVAYKINEINNCINRLENEKEKLKKLTVI